MQILTTAESRFERSKALGLMSQARDILDDLRAPGPIGSTLDLAIARLEKFLGHDDQSAVQALNAQLEREYIRPHADHERITNPWEIPRA